MDRKLGQKPDRKLGHERYARVPYSVLLDHELSTAARCVYAFLASCVFQGTVARVGQRRIASQLGLSRSTVQPAIMALVARGHVEIAGEGTQRATYHLTSRIFGEKQRALDAGEAIAEELISAPRRRLATVRKTA